MDRPRLAGLETTLVPDGWSGRIGVRSGIDTTVVNGNGIADALVFRLRPAGALRSVSFDLRYRGQRIMVTMDRYRLRLAAQLRAVPPRPRRGRRQHRAARRR